MKSLSNRLGTALVEEVLTNWRLALLGLTGLVLSIASGWTTWDGMTNFTGNPVLSLLITFGIQGVMLIAAWLIGETFALGLQARGDGHTGGVFWGLFLLLSVVVIAVLFALVTGSNSSGLGWEIIEFGKGWARSVAGAILLLALLGGLVYALTQREIIGPYLRGGKIIIQNLPIWLMFLSCMATSVFFSFDSLFSTIFPESERKRVGDIRAQNRISGILADVEARLQVRQLERRAALFQSEAWTKYDAALDLVQTQARRAPDLINAERKKKIAVRALEAQRFREQESTAKGRFRNLKAEKDRRLEIIDRFERLRPPIVVEVDKLATALQVKRKALLEARAEAKAEVRGVGNTQHAGRGPKYRALAKVVTKLSIEEELIAEQLKGAQENLAKFDSEIATARREVEGFDIQIATYGSQAEAAGKMLEAGTRERANSGEASSFSVDGFEASRAAFRQAPTKAKFAMLQRQCSSILATLVSVPQLEGSVKGVDCEPRDASALAGRVFAVNAAIKRYGAQCGRAALATSGDVDKLIKHGQQCLLVSGLSGADSADFRQGFNRVELNRDDRAHRFVVTWNAFLDGNRLAYLALAIAIAIDGLVFMSGMFGANALKTPLAEGSGAAGRTAAQLDDLMESALLPDKMRSTDVVLGVLRPSSKEGFSQKVDLSTLDQDQTRIVQNVINVGSVIGLVEEDLHNPDVYYVRRQLFEKISHIRQREVKLVNANAVDNGLRLALERALLPENEMLANISRVMKFMQPSDADAEFGLEIVLAGATGETLERARRVLTAGASRGVVKPHPKLGDIGYLIKNEFYDQLDEIRKDRLSWEKHQNAVPTPTGGSPEGDVTVTVDTGWAGRQVPGQQKKLLSSSGASHRVIEGDYERIFPEGASDTNSGFEQIEDPYGDVDGQIRQQFGERLSLSKSEIEYLLRDELKTVAEEIDEMLSKIGSSEASLGQNLDRNIQALLGDVGNCRRKLIEKYGSNENARDTIEKTRTNLQAMIPLYVMRENGFYERAIGVFVKHIQSRESFGQEDAGTMLTNYEHHATELLMIKRELTDAADWDGAINCLSEFYQALKFSGDGSGRRTVGIQLN